METPGPTSGRPALPATSSAATARWQVGQLLQATVTASEAGRVLLSIGNRQVSSETSLPLEKGQQLTLLVRSLGPVPELRITSLPGSASGNELIRTLLPRQDSLAPLLASLAQLARTPAAPVPPLVRELVRMLIQGLPDTRAVSQPQGLRQAIQQSGLFLERHLLDQAGGKPQPGTAPTPVEADFKARLLQLIQRLRNWPGQPDTGPENRGTRPPPRAPAPPAGATPTPAPATTATATRSGAPERAANAAPPDATPVRNAAPGREPARAAGNEILQRATRALAAPPPGGGGNTPGPATSAPPGATAVQTSGSTGVASGTSATARPAATAAPPLPGATPTPQAAAEATLDVLNRLGRLHPDLLRQAEAALARIQLHQLASQPRDGDRGLLEWLFELPVRRGDELDLWSLRIAREAPGKRDTAQRQAPRWSVQLAFDLPGLGPVQAQVTLQGERVSTRFWPGNASVLPLFREHLQELQGMLSAAGLDVGELDCRPGPMPAGARPHQALIRDKA